MVGVGQGSYFRAVLVSGELIHDIVCVETWRRGRGGGKMIVGSFGRFEVRDLSFYRQD